ncbi:16S rRNA (guanine(966)-N(2))-methyltransferase RsmD [Phosphitispora sp. TUW77]|uniref:16S rRNA (guanine(966)-N(2))-methyltransferase RsmD n=1 Tax=Phosphitispora sp. TUW77 TaxID=3152361 RepID=UPI003AB1B665
MKQVRVITGSAKGRRLKSLKGMETRPTMDRTKESLFNIINERIFGSWFLDLYAGTGAIGIEALSRGADKAVFIENNPRAVKIIRDNLEQTELSGRSDIFCASVENAVVMLAKQKKLFDIIYMDPPYGMGIVQETIDLLCRHLLLQPGGLIITEGSKMDQLQEKTSCFTMFRQEKYGDTMLSFYRMESVELTGRGEQA